MKLRISYIKPCNERNKLTARFDFKGTVDVEKLKQEFETKNSEKLGLMKFSVGNVEVMLSDNHIDIRNAEREHEILEIMGKLKQFIKETS